MLMDPPAVNSLSKPNIVAGIISQSTRHPQMLPLWPVWGCPCCPQLPNVAPSPGQALAKGSRERPTHPELIPGCA